jgi:multiple sugar transport system substrate-binding protein
MDVTTATNVEKEPLKMPHIAGAVYAIPWQKGTTMDTINVEFQNYVPSVISGERSLEAALKIAEDEANKTIEANN